MRLCISVKIDGAGFIQEEEEEELTFIKYQIQIQCISLWK